MTEMRPGGGDPTPKVPAREDILAKMQTAEDSFVPREGVYVWQQAFFNNISSLLLPEESKKSSRKLPLMFAAAHPGKSVRAMGVYDKDGGNSEKFLDGTYESFFSDIDRVAEESGVDAARLALRIETKDQVPDDRESIRAYYEEIFGPEVRETYVRLRLMGYSHEDLRA
ncbi:MAG: hypothetical protein AAB553_00865 [Patescibacteria group bacterium]